MFLALVLAATPALPTYLTLPKGAVVPADSIIDERYGVDELYETTGAMVEKKGRHWAASVSLPEAQGLDHAPLWAPFKKALLAGGWTVHQEAMDSNPAYATVRYKKGGKDVLATFSLFASDDVRVAVIEAGPYPGGWPLKAPGAKVEAVGEKDDFPWLTPPPGSTFTGESKDDGDFRVKLPGDEEESLVAQNSRVKSYTTDKALSNLDVVTAYREGLAKNGWTILESSGGLHQGDLTVTAHYAKNGRNLWAYVHGAQGELSFKVADAGAEDWEKALEKTCAVTLSGVNFDFNKATLKPESTPVLEKAAALLKAKPALAIEVQGHTDAVGDDATNQKLSEARAETVRAWLAGHGTEPKRLSAHGYGRSQPVADNGTAEGRAKNRRVELRRTDCKK
jgi:outer membrane protein OmpA-like peptidoglycan-associated protein